MRPITYVNRGHKLAGKNCVTSVLNSDDKVIAGPKGEIRQVGPALYEVIIAISSSGEKKIPFKINDLLYWYEKIQAPFNATTQEAYANDPNGRLDRFHGTNN